MPSSSNCHVLDFRLKLTAPAKKCWPTLRESPTSPNWDRWAMQRLEWWHHSSPPLRSVPPSWSNANCRRYARRTYVSSQSYVLSFAVPLSGTCLQCLSFFILNKGFERRCWQKGQSHNTIPADTANSANGRSARSVSWPHIDDDAWDARLFLFFRQLRRHTRTVTKASVCPVVVTHE